MRESDHGKRDKTRSGTERATFCIYGIKDRRAKSNFSFWIVSFLFSLWNRMLIIMNCGLQICPMGKDAVSTAWQHIEIVIHHKRPSKVGKSYRNWETVSFKRKQFKKWIPVYRYTFCHVWWNMALPDAVEFSDILVSLGLWIKLDSNPVDADLFSGGKFGVINLKYSYDYLHLFCFQYIGLN